MVGNESNGLCPLLSARDQQFSDQLPAHAISFQLLGIE